MSSSSTVTRHVFDTLHIITDEACIISTLSTSTTNIPIPIITQTLDPWDLKGYLWESMEEISTSQILDLRDVFVVVTRHVFDTYHVMDEACIINPFNIDRWHSNLNNDTDSWPLGLKGLAESMVAVNH